MGDNRAGARRGQVLQRGTLWPGTQRLGEARASVCKHRGHVRAGHVGTRPPNLQGSGEKQSKAGGARREAPAPALVGACCWIYKCGREKSACPSWSTACKGMLPELHYPSDFVSECTSSWIVSQVSEPAGVTWGGLSDKCFKHQSRRLELQPPVAYESPANPKDTKIHHLRLRSGRLLNRKLRLLPALCHLHRSVHPGSSREKFWQQIKGFFSFFFELRYQV